MLLILLFTLPSGAQPARSDSPRLHVGPPWNWLSSAKKENLAITIIHPSPQAVMQRDQSAAEAQDRAISRRENAVFQKQHRAKLEDYVGNRVDSAGINARLAILSSKQTMRGDGLSARAASIYSTAIDGLSAVSKQVAGTWIARSDQKLKTNNQKSIGETIIQKTRHAATEIPRRTKNIVEGNDELVTGGLANGIPKGLAVFLALLMLHVPSVALASFVTGIFLIRGHQPRAGILLLGIASVLSIVIFFALPN